MKTIAIHQKEDWFLVNIPGYGDIPKTSIEVEVNLAKEEFNTLDYKSLRGAAIMERYYEKIERQIEEIPTEEIKVKFDNLFSTHDIKTIDDLINSL